MAETTAERLAAVCARTDRILEMLAPDAVFAQPIVFAEFRCVARG